MSKDLQFSSDDMSELIQKAKKVLSEEPKGSSKYNSALEFLFKNADPEQPGASKSARKEQGVSFKRRREPSPTSDSTTYGSDAERETQLDWLAPKGVAEAVKKGKKRVKSKPEIVESDNEEDEDEVSTSKKGKKRVKSKPEIIVSEEEEEDDEAVIDAAESSQKRFKVVKKPAILKPASKNVADEEKVFFGKASEFARIPKRATSTSAGFDLTSVCMRPIFPMQSQIIDTGIKAIFPPNTYGRIAARSGLALKHSLFVGGGVIDNDYRGTIHVVLTNLGKKLYMVHTGHRIAQLVVEKYFSGPGEDIEKVENDTKRGELGFGSTGITGDAYEDIVEDMHGSMI